MTQQSVEITRLELLVMEHERSLEHYSDLIMAQQAQIDQLKQDVRQLALRMQAAGEANSIENPHQPPPHY